TASRTRASPGSVSSHSVPSKRSNCEGGGGGASMPARLVLRPQQPQQGGRKQQAQRQEVERQPQRHSKAELLQVDQRRKGQGNSGGAPDQGGQQRRQRC